MSPTFDCVRPHRQLSWDGSHWRCDDCSNIVYGAGPGPNFDVEQAYKALDNYIFRHLAYDKDGEFVGLMQSAAAALKARINKS